MEAAPTAAEKAAVDELLGPPEAGREGGHQRTERDLRVVRGGHEARALRHLLLPALHALQSGVGWISRGGMNYVCQRLSVPPAEAYGVATFYAMFSVEERPRTVVHVCDDLACRGQGGIALCDDLARDVGPAGADAGGWTWQRSPCLGMCERAPAIFAQRAGRTEISVGRATRESIASIVVEDSSVASSGPDGAVRGPVGGLRLLRRVGVADPTSIDDYRAHGGYEALRRAIELGPEAVIQAVS
jgi:NADH-quinone oxidoreductase subunit F